MARIGQCSVGQTNFAARLPQPWRAFTTSADAFADEKSGCFILDSLADHDFAADVHHVEHTTNRVTRVVVGRFLDSIADPCRQFSAAISVARRKSNSRSRRSAGHLVGKAGGVIINTSVAELKGIGGKNAAEPRIAVG